MQLLYSITNDQSALARIVKNIDLSVLNRNHDGTSLCDPITNLNNSYPFTSLGSNCILHQLKELSEIAFSKLGPIEGTSLYWPVC
jgi:hypothetical protein